jgi:hypothetical protein
MALEMKRFWLSWWERADNGDSRPLKWPLPKEIQYWNSGSRSFGDNGDVEEHSLCAIVDAPSEEAAWALIAEYWKPGEQRFIEMHEPGWVPGDRFPGAR